MPKTVKCTKCLKEFKSSHKKLPKYCSWACYKTGHDWYSDAALRVNTGKGVRRRRGDAAPQTIKTLNRDAFKTETDESAYWIGFLITDGCILRRKTGSAHIVLALAHRDIDHLIKFQKFLGSNHKITHVKKTNADRLAVTSDEIADTLEKYGVVPRKSYTAKVIGLEFNRHFWRGVIDGDGYIGLYRCRKSRLPRIGLVGSRYLLHQFKDFAVTVVPRLRSDLQSNRNIFKIDFNGNAAGELVKYLYSDCATFLDRKRARALQIIAHIEPAEIITRKGNSNWLLCGKPNPAIGKLKGYTGKCISCCNDFYRSKSKLTIYCSRKCYLCAHDWKKDRALRGLAAYA